MTTRWTFTMILTDRVDEANLIWIDGLIPGRATLKEEFSPNSLRKFGIRKCTKDLARKASDLGTISARDKGYQALLKINISHQNDIGIQKCDNFVVFYIRPPCIKPSYEFIRQSLRTGTYSLENLSLLKYGPEWIMHKRRQDRYRQIVAWNTEPAKERFLSDALSLPSSDDFLSILLKSLDDTSFVILESNYKRSNWGLNLFEMEAKKMLSNWIEAINGGEMHNYIARLETQGFEIYRI
jgi:hypothetical protein